MKYLSLKGISFFLSIWRNKCKVPIGFSCIFISFVSPIERLFNGIIDLPITLLLSSSFKYSINTLSVFVSVIIKEKFSLASVFNSDLNMLFTPSLLSVSNLRLKYKFGFFKGFVVDIPKTSSILKFN